MKEELEINHLAWTKIRFSGECVLTQKCVKTAIVSSTRFCQSIGNFAKEISVRRKNKGVQHCCEKLRAARSHIKASRTKKMTCSSVNPVILVSIKKPNWESQTTVKNVLADAVEGKTLSLGVIEIELLLKSRDVMQENLEKRLYKKTWKIRLDEEEELKNMALGKWLYLQCISGLLYCKRNIKWG